MLKIIDKIPYRKFPYRKCIQAVEYSAAFLSSLCILTVLLGASFDMNKSVKSILLGVATLAAWEFVAKPVFNSIFDKGS